MKSKEIQGKPATNGTISQVFVVGTYISTVGEFKIKSRHNFESE